MRNSDGYATTNGMSTMSNNATANTKNSQEKSRSTTPAWNQNYVQPNSTEVAGSAANLVGRVRKRRTDMVFYPTKSNISFIFAQVLVEQGLGDRDFVHRIVSREMQEALNMTSEEMDLAAHRLIQQNHMADR